MWLANSKYEINNKEEKMFKPKPDPFHEVFMEYLKFKVPLEHRAERSSD